MDARVWFGSRPQDPFVPLERENMKCVNAANPAGVRRTLILAGLVLVSTGAQASVTLTQDSGSGSFLVDMSSAYIQDYFWNDAAAWSFVTFPQYSGSNFFLADMPPVYIQDYPRNAPAVSSSVSGALHYRIGSNTGAFNESDFSHIGSAVEIDREEKGHAYQATSSADVGQLQARVATKWNSSNGNGYNYGSNYGSSSAEASSSWSDWFVITGGTGEGVASFVSALDGMMRSSKNGTASYSLNIGYSIDSYFTCFDGYDSCGLADQNQTLFSQTSSLSGRGETTVLQQIESEFTFAYDKPFQLTATLNVGGTSGGVADFSLSSLSDSLVLPAGVQLLSTSGHFAQPVPEPETYAMMLAGLGLVGWAVAHRRRRASK